MKYKCLVLDHDDTVVNSTATIHYPCFEAYLEDRKPHLVGKFDLPTFFEKNFEPGVLEFFANDVGLTEEEMQPADVNIDGEVNQYDYILIKRHYFGTFVIG